jgi:hypothetical protein
MTAAKPSANVCTLKANGEWVPAETIAKKFRFFSGVVEPGAGKSSQKYELFISSDGQIAIEKN